MFLFVFSFALLIANIYCFAKKKYLYLFIPCMLFLPEYYGIDFTYTLPILTVARMMFIVFYIYAYINRRRPLTLKGLHIHNIPKPYLFLAGYFILRLVSNLYYVTTYSAAAKTIFEIIFEQLLLLYAIYLLAPTKDEILTLIKVVVWAACIIFITGILESLTSLRPFDALYTVSRDMSNQHYMRLGLLRATATMGLAVLYGNICLMLFPLVLYVYIITEQKRYLAVCTLNILAIIHSGSRADILFFFFIALLYFILIVLHIGRIKKFLINTIAIFFSLTIIISALSMHSPTYKYFYLGTAKSVLNEIGFNFDLEEDVPEGIEGFGENEDGSASRLTQFTGIKYTMSINPIFGLGSQPLSRKSVYYYSNNLWHPAKAFDVGIVEVFCSEGVLGVIAHLFLYISIIVPLIKKRGIRKMPLSYRFSLLSTLTYLVCMLCTANIYSVLFLLVILSYSAVTLSA